MFLTNEEQKILDGEQGEILKKLMKLVVQLGESFGAEKLIPIKSAHTVLNFGINFVNAAADVLHQIAESNLKVKVRTSADPIIDMDYSDELSVVYPMFTLHDQMMEDLNKLGIHGFTCTPYFLDNKPNRGDHCAWSESSAVIYLNSVLGAKSNREGGLVDIACGILGKTSYHGLHIDEYRKGQVLFNIDPKININELFNLTSIGLRIGEIAGSRIPVLDGIPNITFDQIKNLGAASAASGAVALIHVLGKTPEAKTREMAFQGDEPEEFITITERDLTEVRGKYSTEWNKEPQNIAVGCPQLSEEEVIEILHKIEGKTILEGINFWICTNQKVKESIKNSDLNRILVNSGAKITHLCPLLTALPRPVITNSAKTCFYSNASYRSIDDCIQIASEGISSVK